MPVAFSDLALFSLLGVSAGILAGMLGIGGGMIIVPGLFYLFSLIHLPDQSLLHMAAGSAMGIMLFTASASTWSHHKRGDVQWHIFRQAVPGIAAGVVIGTLLSSYINEYWLEVIFGVFLLAVSSKILMSWSPTFDESEGHEPSGSVASMVGSLIGLKSGILGIGGGALSVPFLLYCGLPMKQASGTSASFTLPIAVTGTLAFALLSPSDPYIQWSTGYIYWPAIALVAPFTVIGAPIGTMLSHRIPAGLLKRIFAVLILCIGGKMLLGSLSFLF